MTAPRSLVLAVTAAAVAVAVGCAACSGPAAPTPAAVPSPAAATRAAAPTPAPVSSAATSATATSSRSAPPVTTAANAVPTGSRGTPRGGVVPGVQRGDPSSVAAAVAATVFGWDTRIDRSPQDAARRAMGWMTPQLAARTQAAATSGGGAAWDGLAAHRGWTGATVRADPEYPATTTSTAAVQRVVVTVTPHTADKTRLPGQSWLVLLTLQRGPGRTWLVSQVLPQPDGTGQP